MYEMELAFMVIAHSQRDPGEYMLQLQHFAAQPEGHLRKHALDMHLGRWRHALSDLLHAGPQRFEQALALASDKVRDSCSPLVLAVVCYTISPRAAQLYPEEAGGGFDTAHT